MSKVEALYTEITDVLNRFEQKSISFAHKSVDTSELHKHIMDLKDQLAKEKDDYNVSTTYRYHCYIYPTLTPSTSLFLLVSFSPFLFYEISI